jgi:hypothetical protein
VERLHAGLHACRCSYQMERKEENFMCGYVRRVQSGW